MAESATDMRQRITTEAVRLFGQRGFEGTSIQAVAEAVGIRKQSLLHYFPSKEELHRHVVASLVIYWKNELPRILSAADSGYGRFDGTIMALVGFFLEDPERARLTVREMLDRPDMLSALMKEHLNPWARLIAEYIRLGQASGIIRPEIKPESYVGQIMLMTIATAALGQAAAALVRGGSAEDAPLDVDELVRIAHDALFVRPRSAATSKQGKRS